MIDKKSSTKKHVLILLVMIFLLIFSNSVNNTKETKPSVNSNQTVESVPEFSGNSYIVINNNIPKFTSKDKKEIGYERYSEFDELGRSGVAYAVVGLETMSTDNRESNGQIKPSGWHTVRYDIVDGQYLYNRCHLIGYQLTAENGNAKNLITGTRYLNVKGMLQFENKVADYVKETGNHVRYKATPIYDGDNLVASGVQIEAKAIEDKSFYFNVYVYNVQPGIVIDYKNGDSYLEK